MGGGRGGRSPPGWGWGKGSFPGEKTWRTSRDSVYVEGRVLMVEVKLRAKVKLGPNGAGQGAGEAQRTRAQAAGGSLVKGPD